MINERTDVQHPMWRKKVDGTLLRLGATPIPLWVTRMWSVEVAFRDVAGRSDPRARVDCSFRGGIYPADIVPYREGRQFRLFLDDALRAALADAFLMTQMRDLDRKLAPQGSPNTSGHAQQAAFWEFLDLEYDASARSLRLTAHYVQQPTFPNLFKRLAGSPAMKRIDDELAGRDKVRIHKQSWRPRSEYAAEIGARNVIYMLADVDHGLFYVGEAVDLIARFRRGHAPIPEWTHYRYDLLPESLTSLRVTLERMIICDVDAILGGWTSEMPARPGGFRLVNSKIDR